MEIEALNVVISMGFQWEFQHGDLLEIFVRIKHADFLWDEWDVTIFDRKWWKTYGKPMETHGGKVGYT